MEGDVEWGVWYIPGLQLGGEMLRSCTIFLTNWLRAPQKQVHVRLGAHPFSPPAPFLAAGQKKCAGLFGRRRKNSGSLFAAGVFFSGGHFFVILSAISC